MATYCRLKEEKVYISFYAKEGRERARNQQDIEEIDDRGKKKSKKGRKTEGKKQRKKERKRERERKKEREIKKTSENNRKILRERERNVMN